MDNDLLLPHAVVVASNCKLPEYWPDAPALWFSRAECSFLLRNVMEQREKFCLVVQYLPRDSMRLVADLVEAPPAELMYIILMVATVDDNIKLLSVGTITSVENRTEDWNARYIGIKTSIKLIPNYLYFFSQFDLGTYFLLLQMKIAGPCKGRDASNRLEGVQRQQE
jgi:hypothetical protein